MRYYSRAGDLYEQIIAWTVCIVVVQCIYNVLLVHSGHSVGGASDPSQKIIQCLATSNAWSLMIFWNQFFYFPIYCTTESPCEWMIWHKGIYYSARPVAIPSLSSQQPYEVTTTIWLSVCLRIVQISSKKPCQKTPISMGAITTILVSILILSLIIFIALFGRLPIFRYVFGQIYSHEQDWKLIAVSEKHQLDYAIA